MHDGQINEIGIDFAKSEARNNQIQPWKHTEAHDFGNNGSRSFIDPTLRQSIKPLPKP